MRPIDPNDIPPTSSFNVDAMIILGKLQESTRTILNTQTDQAASIREIHIRLNDLSAITQLQSRHDVDITELKKEVGGLKERWAWLMGVSAAVSAVLSLVINFFKGHS